MKTPGQLAYEIYRGTLCEVALWRELDIETQTAWQLAAQAVLARQEKETAARELRDYGPHH